MTGIFNNNRAVLVTGGAGYIGSHTCVELLQAGRDVIIFDNLSNGKSGVVSRIEKIVGRRPIFIEGDIRDGATLDQVFTTNPVAAVLHFAALKSPFESIARPHEYYDNNVGGSQNLIDSMARHGIHTLVFSSSAAVYGADSTPPIREDAPLQAIHPYGRTKIMTETMLRDICDADDRWRVASLRYFNPVGAHDSGLIGEDTGEMPNNLVPYISQVAAGHRECLSIFGSEYPTPDGTGIRDYIHVVDVAKGHLAALNYIEKHPGAVTVNLGTGQGYSVLQMLRAFEKASGKTIPHRFVESRAGDPAVSYADPDLAKELFGWRAQLDLEQMCRDTWRWQQWSDANITK